MSVNQFVDDRMSLARSVVTEEGFVEIKRPDLSSFAGVDRRDRRSVVGQILGDGDLPILQRPTCQRSSERMLSISGDEIILSSRAGSLLGKNLRHALDKSKHERDQEHDGQGVQGEVEPGAAHQSLHQLCAARRSAFDRRVRRPFFGRRAATRSASIASAICQRRRRHRG